MMRKCLLMAVAVAAILLACRGNAQRSTNSEVAEPELPVEQVDSQLPKSVSIEFSETRYDFGKILSQEYSHTFTFYNKGKEPLVISRVTTNCGCSSATYTQEPVSPGDSGQVVLQVDGKMIQPGRFLRSAEVFVAGATDPSVELLFRGEVVRELPKDAKK